MSEKIKVMLVDDEQLIRSGLKIMLETYPDIEVIHQAGNGREAFECCKKRSSFNSPYLLAYEYPLIQHLELLF